MKKITLTFFLTAILCSLNAADHIMETISGDLGGHVQVVELDDYLYVPHGSVLSVYDGTTLVDFPLPVVSGTRLRYYYGGLFVFNSAVFAALSNADGTRQYISRFTGSGFSRFTLPSPLISEVVVFNGLMHMVLQTPSGLKLYSYDGATLREIASSFSFTNNCQLKVAGSYLYINGIAYSGGETTWLQRYNGTSFRTMSMPTGVRRLTGVFQVGSSANAYLVMEDRVVCYYNGSALSELFRAVTSISSGTLWRNEFYFRSGSGMPENPERFYKYNGTTRTTISPPAGAQYTVSYHNQQMAVYRDALYIPLDVGGIASIHRYDGTTWQRIYDWDGDGYGLVPRERAGKLVFFKVLNSNRAVEYDGETFESFTAPEGVEWFVDTRPSTSCYHVWLGAFADVSDYSWVLVKETFDSTCVAPGSVVIIPERLREYDYFGMVAYARERDWCWTGIDINWGITPVCPTPPCAPPSVKTTLADKNGKIGWQKTFDKPFTASVPLNDTQPYSLAIALGKDQTFKDVLLFDKDLVNKGVEELSLDMYPKEDHFFLTVITDNNKQVPFTMTLRNVKGESLWQQHFVAPMDELIRAYVPKAGDYLHFSPLQAPKSVTLYYPNPFTSKLNINTTEASGPVSVSLTSMSGKVITQKDFVEPGEYSLDIGSQKPGLYILTIVEGGNVRRELVEVK